MNLKTAFLFCVLAAPAAASPFQYGDIFVSTSGGIKRFNQSGVLLQTIASGIGGLGFDPSGNLYIAVGSSVQKFDNSGNALGAFASGFPGTLGTANDVDFDAAGNGYVAGIQDLNNDFIQKFTNTGTLTGTRSFLQGQENFVFIDASRSGTLLVTPGTTSSVSKFNSATLADAGSVANPGGNVNGGVQALPDGGLLVISNNPINQYNAAGAFIASYNSVLSGSFIGVDSFTGMNFWAVSDFGEVRSFNLGNPNAVASFSAGGTARDIAVYTLPEPATFLGLGSGLLAVGLALRRRRALQAAD